MEGVATAANVRESWWVLSLSLAAKCCVATSSSLNLLSFALLLLLASLIVGLLYWTSPGGPAWGRYSWTRVLRGSSSTIPGPRGLPFLGSMGLMSGLAHRHLAAAAKLFHAERLMAFSIGDTRAIVTSNPDVAREILNSSAFADRPVKESAYGLMFHRSIGFAPYGTYWRTLRRIASSHLFFPKQITVSGPHRSEIAAQTITTLGMAQGLVRVRDVLKQASLYNIMSSVFGRRYEIGLENNHHEVRELHSLVDEGYDLLGMVNWSDHLSLFTSFDLQGIRSRCSEIVPRVNRLVGKIIEEHRANYSKNSIATAQDFVDVLLSLQESEKLSDDDVVAVLWEMIFRGTDTVAVLMEWVMARMVLHVEIQEKAQEELDKVVGKSRPVAESDVAALPYLQAIVKETLRLHPPGPLLSWARLSIYDTVVDGCHVPKGTTAMVNMWAITHDPHVWEEPEEFRPERFMGDKDGAGVAISVFGSDLRLAPFGAGRRSCPGKALGMTTVGFWVASLLHEYVWAPPPSDSTGGSVDLSEVLRLSCEMAAPLMVKLRPRRR